MYGVRRAGREFYHPTGLTILQLPVGPHLSISATSTPDIVAHVKYITTSPKILVEFISNKGELLNC